VAQNGHIARTWGFFAAQERASEQRPNLKDIEQLGGDPHPVVALGLFRPADVDGPAVVGGEARERPLLLAVIEEIMNLCQHAVVAARQVLSCHGDESIGIGEGHALEQRAVDDAEHRRRKSDAEREGEHRDRGESAALTQRTRAVPDVSENRVHGGRG